MTSEISFVETGTSEMAKPISPREALQFLKRLETETSWPVFHLIKMLLDGNANSGSITASAPHRFLYLGRASDRISVRLETKDKEIKLSIPAEDLK